MVRGSKGDSPLLHEVLKCEGYWGFAAGWFRASVGAITDEIYCNACPKGAECWTKHHTRVRELFPAACEAFDRLADSTGLRDRHLMEEWKRRTHSSDPFTSVCAANLHIGSYIGQVKSPPDYGPMNLPEELWKPLLKEH
jgi:hypothetical protein